MTNKSLSQQICEICGIEPYYGIYVNFGDLDNNYKLVTNKRKYRLIADCRYIVDNEDELKNLEPKYLPDFESVNFTKLFKLITTAEGYSFSTGHYYISQIPTHRQFSCLSTPDGEYESESIDPIKAFLTCVFKCAVKEKDTANFIKQQQWDV